MANALTRMWIDQPSTLQPHHALHGTNVLAEHEFGDTMRIYFLSGAVSNQQISKMALSAGWQPAAPVETVSQAIMREKSAATFVNKLHLMVANTRVKDTPQFLFVAEMKDTLIKNGFEPQDAKAMADCQMINLPGDATVSEVKDLGYHCAELVTKCYNDLRTIGKFDDPLAEAVRLAKALLSQAR